MRKRGGSSPPSRTISFSAAADSPRSFLFFFYMLVSDSMVCFPFLGFCWFLQNSQIEEEMVLVAFGGLEILIKACIEQRDRSWYILCYFKCLDVFL
jgi:hypothetical protein